MTLFFHSYDDPLREFEAREAILEARRAAAISRAEGRQLDAYGFAAPADPPPADQRRAGMPEPTRRQRLSQARFIAEVKAAAAAERETCRRLCCEAFEPSPIGEVMAVSEMFPETYWGLSLNKER